VSTLDELTEFRNSQQGRSLVALAPSLVQEDAPESAAEKQLPTWPADQGDSNFQRGEVTVMRRCVRVLLAFVFQGVTFAVGAEGPPTCAIATNSEKIGGGTIVYNTVGTGLGILLVHGLFANK
jgi:hypothetical protein